MDRLQHLRREIDQIDEKLHDLLMRRIEIGREVAEAKKSDMSSKLRPGREAQIMRVLASRNRTPLSLDSISRIWREILSANLNQQIAVTAALYAPNIDYYDLAQDYCGSSSKIMQYESAEEVLKNVRNGSAQIGILPGFLDEKERKWWVRLINQGEKDRINIISVIPLLESKKGRYDSVIVAAQEPDESGCDSTLFAVRGELNPKLGNVIDSGYGQPWKLLIVEGFVEEIAGAAHLEWFRLGSFANKIVC
ncbi:MAG: hypothetical protein CMM58_01565 [Rhodospirillaceae bacterium]|nr:hypothetical protein [Rhodospirillaceae bacterium]